MESRGVEYSSSTSGQQYEIVYSKSEYRITHAYWACENIGYTIGDLMPDTRDSIDASWGGTNKKFWTTINDFDTEGTFVYSNGEVADVTVVGNTPEKNFVIYDMDTGIYTAADYRTDTAYYFCTRSGIFSKMILKAERLKLIISVKKSASFVVRMVKLERLFGFVWSRNSITIPNMH